MNTARSLIYTTALPPHSVEVLLHHYHAMRAAHGAREKLRSLIALFKKNTAALPIIPSESAIQSVLVKGAKEVTRISDELQRSGFEVRAIRAPTVKEGEERLRIILHSFNSEKEVQSLAARLEEIL